MSKCLTTLISLALLCVAPASGETHPNLTGTWKQNNEKSGLRPGAAVWVHKIEHKDPNLKIVTTITGSRGETTSERTYTTDGREQVTKDPEGDEFTISVKWEASALVFLTVEKEGAKTIITRETWSLSEGGKTLTKARHTTGPRGTTDQKYVFEKQ